MIHISDYLKPVHTLVPLQADSKAGAVEQLIERLVQAGAVANPEWARRAVWDRENTRTTGIGNGVALPHGKTAAVEDLVLAVGTHPEGIDFESVDGRPARIFILILSPLSRTSQHIQALARISRLLSMDACRRAILSAQTPKELCNALIRQERELTTSA